MKEERLKKETEEKNEGLVPTLLEKLVDAVDLFASGLIRTVSDTAEDLVNRGMQRLFGLLLTGVGLVFLLTGGAMALNDVLDYPGIGQIIVGAMILTFTSLFFLVPRSKK